MRAFRAFLALVAAILLWGAWRWPAASSDFEDYRVTAAGVPTGRLLARREQAQGEGDELAGLPSEAQLRDRTRQVEERLVLLDRLAYLEARLAELESRHFADRKRWQLAARRLDAADLDLAALATRHGGAAAAGDDAPSDGRRRDRDAEEAERPPEPELPAVRSGAARAGGEPGGRGSRAYELASLGYQRLAAGDRRSAAGLFDEAVRLDSRNANAPAWAAQRNLIGDRWSADVYMMMREGSESSFDPSVAAAPVLGGGQTGATLSYVVNPFSPTPVTIGARATAAQRRLLGVDSQTSQAAVGASWKPWRRLPVTLTGERLVKLSPGARNDWALRLAGGVEQAGPDMDIPGPLDWSAYAEAGLIGLSSRDSYAAAQARIGSTVVTNPRWSLNAGLGSWGSVQNSGQTVGRLDVGPNLRLRLTKPLPIEVSADYRLKALGNADPGSGPALTVSSRF